MNLSKIIVFIVVLTIVGNLASAKSLPVFMRGSCNDSSIQFVKIVRYSPFWGEFTPVVLAKKNKRSNNEFIINFNINEPVHAYFMIMRHTWDIYITPGDSIYFKIKRDNNNKLQISFTGKHASNYNYDVQLEESLKLHPKPKYSNPKLYKKNLDSWYQWRINFLTDYKESNKVFPDFIKYEKNEIKYEYIRYLYTPIQRGKLDKDTISSNYFKLADGLSMKDASGFHFSDNSKLAYTYKYILCYTENTWDNFDSIYSNIKQNFSGIIRAYLVSNLIGVFAKKQLQSYSSSLLEAIKGASKYVEDSECLNYIVKCEQEYLLLNKPFPKKILENTYLKSFSNTRLSLADLLKKYKEQAVYFDFWASWCAACRVDIAHSSQAKKFLNDKKVIYIYISMDTKINEDKWRKAALEDNITKNQYILIDDFSSPLNKFLNINYLPRYIIIGKNHNIKNINAPRPTKNHLSQLKMSIIDALKVVYNY